MRNILVDVTGIDLIALASVLVAGKVAEATWSGDTSHAVHWDLGAFLAIGSGQTFSYRL